MMLLLRIYLCCSFRNAKITLQLAC